jgi:hypothetical protein
VGEIESKSEKVIIEGLSVWLVDAGPEREQCRS